MDAERTLPLSHRPKKSGSEKRQRERRVSFRVTGSEYDQAQTAAQAAGLTVASFARSRVVLAPQTRARQKPRADVVELAKLRAELNRIGGNVNQIARAFNQGRVPDSGLLGLLQDALAHLIQTLNEVRKAMGFRA